MHSNYKFLALIQQYINISVLY